MAPRKGSGQVYIAIQSGSVEIKGETLLFVRGITRVREGHPMLAAVPDAFEPDDLHVHFEVEQATAAPGEKRGGA